MSTPNKKANPLPKTAEAAPPAELPGVVCTQRVRCGKANCRCVSGNRADLHGPYHYRFWREGGRLRKAYVPAARADATRDACQRRQDRERQDRANLRKDHAMLTEFKSTIREVESALAVLARLRRECPTSP